jgi:hypothetical protein
MQDANRGLSSLNLANNNIGPEGADALASMLEVRRLQFDFCLSNWLFLGPLQDNQTLAALNVNGNRIYGEQTAAIERICEAKLIVLQICSLPTWVDPAERSTVPLIRGRPTSRITWILEMKTA